MGVVCCCCLFVLISYLVELSDKAFGVSNPRYIKRQAQILLKTKRALTTIELTLDKSRDQFDQSHDQSRDDKYFKVATRKLQFLKEIGILILH